LIPQRFFSAAAAQSTPKQEKPAKSADQKKPDQAKPDQKKDQKAPPTQKEEKKAEAAPEALKPEVKIPQRVTRMVDELMTFNLIEMKGFIETVARKLGIPEGQFMSPLTNPYAYVIPPSGIMPAPVPGSAPAQGAPGAPAPGGKAEAKKAEVKKDAFIIKLVKVGDDVKYKVLKEIRGIKPNLSIADSKKLVENLPSVLKEAVPKEEADKWVQKIKEAGGEAVLE